ncbi:MAG: tRNA (adenosine(37)-N6)-threonylcarbamoyltransferase complex dimerization subunit type 1 TsaB [Rhizobiales bacterium]|nr:tRNA (adenosine(37)-N6)-threonylcarbamoyltransferase complex dimerization subunit type 1 TsaB [Hyphomicrobiales bacterium]
MICELAIDTAGASCSAALSIGAPETRKIFTRFADIRRGHAEHIISQVDELLAEAAIGYESLNRISCTMGPGSFTGVRVGIAFAKGMALACDVPLYGAVCSVVAAQKFLRQGPEVEFEPLNFNSSGSFNLCHVLDAGRDEFYVHVFHKTVEAREGSGALKNVTVPLLITHSEVLSFVEQYDISLCFGPGAFKFCELKQQGNSDTSLSCEAVRSIDLDIRAEDLLELEDHYLKKNDEVSPLYLRAPDAKPQLGKTLVRRL